METRHCESCKGKGKHDARTLSTGYLIAEKSCFSCKGTGTFQPINESEILNAILVSPKNKKPRLRSTKPKGNDRAAYVWRMARFHGGVDTHLPIIASLDVNGDPFRKELDALSDRVAREYLGTDMAAAVTWGKALGYI